MKKLLIAVAILVPAIVSAVWYPYALVSSKPPPPAPTFDHIAQSFETQGGGLACYDNLEPWVESSAFTFTTNTSFVAEGSRGLSLWNNTGSDPYTTSPVITPALANSYWYFTFSTTITNAQHEIAVLQSNGLRHASIYVRATGRISLYEDTDLFFGCSPAEGIPTNTLIHVWANYNLPLGDYELAFSTTSTKPTSGPKWTNFTTGASVGFKINQIQLQAIGSNVTNYWDKIRGTNIVIGTAPP